MTPTSPFAAALIVVTLAAGGLTACASDSESDGDTTADRSPQVEPSRAAQALLTTFDGVPGRYTADYFVPKLSMKLTKAWAFSYNLAAAVGVELSSAHVPDARGRYWGLNFIRTEGNEFFDRKGQSVAAPETVDQFVDLLRDRAVGQSSKPRRTSVGGYPAVTFQSEIEQYASLLSVGQFGSFPLEKGWSYRFWVIDTPEQLLLVLAEAPAREFESFVTQASQLVDSVHFED